jgi:outer membrane protein assembly factor BamB
VIIQRLFILILLASSSLALAGCSKPLPALSTAESSAQSLRFAQDWTTSLDVVADIRILAVPGGFVTAAGTGQIFMFDSESGEELWRRDAEEPIVSQLVFIAARETNKSWIAFLVDSGDLLFVPVSGIEPIRRSRLGWRGAWLGGADGAAVVLDPKGALALIDEPGARPIWEMRIPPTAEAAITACGPLLLAGLSDGRLVAIDRRTGEYRWKKNLRSQLAAKPACNGKYAFAATKDNYLHALRLHKKRAGRLWKIKSGADPAATPILLDKTVLLLSNDTYLYGFNRRNGHLRFRSRLDRRPGPAVMIDDVLLVAGSHVNKLDAFRMPLGLKAGTFSLPIGARFVTPPVISGSHVVIGMARYGEEKSSLISLSREKGSTDKKDHPATGQ